MKMAPWEVISIVARLVLAGSSTLSSPKVGLKIFDVSSSPFSLAPTMDFYRCQALGT